MTKNDKMKNLINAIKGKSEPIIKEEKKKPQVEETASTKSERIVEEAVKSWFADDQPQYDEEESVFSRENGETEGWDDFEDDDETTIIYDPRENLKENILKERLKIVLEVVEDLDKQDKISIANDMLAIVEQEITDEIMGEEEGQEDNLIMMGMLQVVTTSLNKIINEI